MPRLLACVIIDVECSDRKGKVFILIWQELLWKSVGQAPSFVTISYTVHTRKYATDLENTHSSYQGLTYIIR